MYKQIKLVFHNKGLRSYIEVDLCRQCPRQDDKGCCGYYSPVFYLTDLAYLIKHNPALIDYIFNIHNITILDASVTVNNRIDGDSYRCHFHDKSDGCRLDQLSRESVCRHFVCPGISWEMENKLINWREFFEHISHYEIELNNRIADLLLKKGLTLRDKNKHQELWANLLFYYDNEIKNLPGFFGKLPKKEEVFITRPINYGRDWPL
ncbi:MAG: hypothetical protein ACOX6E_02230 [Syntrophomonadaceae bacterium]|jgi:hypothetical protein